LNVKKNVKRLEKKKKHWECHKKGKGDSKRYAAN